MSSTLIKAKNNFIFDLSAEYWLVTSLKRHTLITALSHLDCSRRDASAMFMMSTSLNWHLMPGYGRQLHAAVSVMPITQLLPLSHNTSTLTRQRAHDNNICDDTSQNVGSPRARRRTATMLFTPVGCPPGATMPPGRATRTEPLSSPNSKAVDAGNYVNQLAW